MAYAPSNWEDIIRKTIQKEAERIGEEEAREAAKRTEARVRDRIGNIVLTVLKQTSFERFGNELRITVAFPSDTTKAS